MTIEGDVTVVLSSHLVHGLERVCNHLILLTATRVRLCADIDDVLSAHRVLVGPRRSTAELERLFTVVKAKQTERQSRVLARLAGPLLDPAWEVSEIGLEDINPPVAAMGLGGIGRGLRPSQTRQAAQAIARVREFGQYVQSGQEVGNPAARTARIRAELQGLLTIPGLDVPSGSLDPFIDYLAEKIVAETQRQAADTT